ncbi:hypothetical protein PX554_22845 [Sphingomonas sp. H39-1-10]|uniref:hypothetical protein n=1 Tax=Sphingomonas pollutisoli TaxID=3030829 RepID=UPI0023B8F46D|nr:hypothetical protein [Sphingomonas pollutisoli]MDF0490966.1 hypothetical protein [Sphingomonas pollutisoli]
MKLLFAVALAICMPSISFAQVAISGLPSANTMSAGEVVPVVQGGTAKQATAISTARTVTRGVRSPTSAGIRSSSSTYSGDKLPGRTYAIDGTAGRAAFSGLNTKPGSAPVSPVNGELWNTVAGIYGRINGADLGPLAPRAPHEVMAATLTAGVDPSGTTDSTSGLSGAIASAASGNYELYIPCGTYKVTNVSISGSPVVRGASQACVKIVGTNATSDVITLAPHAGPVITDITIDRSVVAIAGAGINSQDLAHPTLVNVTSQNQYVGFRLGATAWARCTFCTSQQNYSDGFYFTDTKEFPAVQWQLLNPLSQKNNGWGYNTQLQSTTGLDTGQTFITAGSFANTAGGFLFGGVPTSAMNDLIMLNPYSSSDGNNGFLFTRMGRFNQISSVFAELAGQTPTGRGQATSASSVGFGMLFDGTGISNSSFSLTSAVFSGNSWAGLSVAAGAGLNSITLTNVRSVGNGASGNNNSGLLLIGASTKYLISGSYIADDGFHTQATGIYMHDGAVAANVIANGVFAQGTNAACNMAIGVKAAVVGSGC